MSGIPAPLDSQGRPLNASSIHGIPSKDEMVYWLCGDNLWTSWLAAPDYLIVKHPAHPWFKVKGTKQYLENTYFSSWLTPARSASQIMQACVIYGIEFEVGY